jgi:hypothetical protein
MLFSLLKGSISFKKVEKNHHGVVHKGSSLPSFTTRGALLNSGTSIGTPKFGEWGAGRYPWLDSVYESTTSRPIHGCVLFIWKWNIIGLIYFNRDHNTALLVNVALGIIELRVYFGRFHLGSFVLERSKLRPPPTVTWLWISFSRPRLYTKRLSLLEYHTQFVLHGEIKNWMRQLKGVIKIHWHLSIVDKGWYDETVSIVYLCPSL